MLSTTIVHVCARCGSDSIRKNANGEQRDKCLACERPFVLPPHGERYDQRFKDQVRAAYQDRRSIRGSTRPSGICYKTVSRQVRGKTEGLPAFKDTLLPSKKGDVPELDELWSFVGARTQTLRL